MSVALFSDREIVEVSREDKSKTLYVRREYRYFKMSQNDDWQFFFDKSIFFRLGAYKRFVRGFFAGRPQKFRFGAARTSTGKESEIAPGSSHEIFPWSKISKLATNHFTLWSFE